MLSTPPTIRHNNMSNPVSAYMRNGAQRIPFTPSPSRLVLHKCPNLPNQSKESQGPLTILMLSLPLAQKIHKMLLASRQVEALAKGLFSGNISEDDVAERMAVLEAEYDRLREAVECELETAWVNAGFLPAAMPAFPAAPNVQAQPTQDTIMGNTEYTVDKNLKRKVKESDSERKNKKRKMSEEDMNEERADTEGWKFPAMVQPLGVQLAMIPLGRAEKVRIGTWEMRRAWGRDVMDEEVPVSPKGTNFVF